MLNYNLNFLIASTVFASLTIFGLFNILLRLRLVKIILNYTKLLDLENFDIITNHD